jgi:hypothetical protein
MQLSNRHSLILIFLLLSFYLTILNRFAFQIIGLSVFNWFIAIFVIFFTYKFAVRRHHINATFDLFKIVWVVFAILCFFKLVASYEILPRAMSSYIRIVLIPIILFVPFWLKIDRYVALKIMYAIPLIAVPLAIFGIIQVGFFQFLPDYLLNFKIQGERGDDYLFNNIILFRANGLFGNPLEYSAFLAFVVCICINYNPAKNLPIVVLLFLSAIVCTLSRASIVVVALLIVYGLTFQKITFYFKILLFFIFCISIYGLVNFDLPQVFALLDRLSGASSEAADSTATRLDYLELAIMEVSKFPYSIIGKQLGTLTSAGEDVSHDIHDGYFLNLLVDLGPFLLLLYLFLHSLILFHAWSLFKKAQTRNEGIFLVSMILIWIFFSIVNSAMSNTACAIAFYFSLGLSIRVAHVKNS